MSENKRRTRRLSRRDFLKGAGAITGTAVVSGIAAACGGDDATATPKPTAVPVVPTATTAPVAAGPKYGGKLTWVIEQDVANVIPFGAVNTSNHWGKEHVYESLVGWDKDLNIVPQLAESWETPDDLTWIWHLRKGVMFHNGEEVTADAVKYSIDLQRDPPAPGSTKGFYPKIDNVEVVDDYTVKFNMSAVDPEVLGYLAWGRYSPIIPVDAYDRWNLVTEAVGTGPFKLLKYVANDRLEYEKFADYWNPELPYLDELVIKILPDENARVAALRAGEIDGCILKADAAKTLERDPGIEILKGVFSAPAVLQFALRNEGLPWEDIRVRQAISAAINRQDIIDKVYAGEAVWSGVIPPGYGDWAIPEDELKAKWQKYDLDKAKQLMADAGHADGFDITIYAIANHAASQNAEVVKEQLKELNINVDIISEEIGTFAKRVGDGDFDLCSTGRGMRHDPSGYLRDFALCHEGNYKNWWDDCNGYQNDEYIKIYGEYTTSLDDKLRHDLARQMQEIVLTDLVHIHLCQALWFHGVRDYVKDMYASYTNFYPGLRTAWLDKA